MTVSVIPADQWKKSRDRIVKRIKRGLHITATNPGPHATSMRYDYVLTAAEVAVVVEEVMRDTERLTLWVLEKDGRLR